MEQKEHKRRVRYKGTHPGLIRKNIKNCSRRNIRIPSEKVIRKGSTPAGMHISICVKEILEFLKIQPGQTGLDATLGYGGHSSAMLKCLEGRGHLYGLDVDPIEMRKEERLRAKGYGLDILTAKLLNFADADQLLPESGPFDFVLADLGVSSMQIDNPERGFTYKFEGPLDLRLNPREGISAAERLADITQPELEGMLTENADEPYARQIAQAVIREQRKGKKIQTTIQLQQVMREGIKLSSGEGAEGADKKILRQNVSGLRIDVNREFEVLEEFLEKLPDLLKSGGRVAVLTFHSGEDRLVKKAFQRMYREGIYREIAKDVIRPSAEECSRNSRARSTKMRWAIRA